MALVGAALWAVFVVAVVTSKPVYLNVDGDSSKSLESSESSESSSSEEAGTNIEPSQSVFTETEMQTDPLDPLLVPSAVLRPSSATFDVSAPPVPEDPQTSTDTFQALPGGPCPTAPGVDVPQQECNSEALRNSLGAGAIMSTKGTEVTSTFQGVLQDTTPSPSRQVIASTPLPFSADTLSTNPAASTLTSAPVCFRGQLTSELDPPRGDSI
ncbi:uncharacterized protein LOC108234971 [Kryptolebias marmoratus]|uniref:uncharacterized protein LOC108234971 n=1 Tax=Kryptolebias marmoratus TaxID=37003 RepID=UPI0007F87375|nr:uncharacterized protein LOC108234971 [Kryptolebias marmoratus]